MKPDWAIRLRRWWRSRQCRAQGRHVWQKRKDGSAYCYVCGAGEPSITSTALNPTKYVERGK
jgi:hypothetical protein